MARRAPDRAGRSPGDVRAGDVEGLPAPRIHVLRYDAQGMEEHHDVSVARAVEAARRGGGVTWIDVHGLGDLAVLEGLWDAFGVHGLVREDITNLSQRPKYEEYDGQGFLVLQMLQAHERLASEQVTIVFGDHWLLSFQERPGDVFDGVRERIRKGRKRMRASGPDYLAYALLDAAVDGFFPVLEHYGELLESVEDEALAGPGQATIERIHDLRRDLLAMRRALWPIREVVLAMQRGEQGGLMARDTQTYLRDVYDHAVRTMDMLENYRELASSLADVYYSTLSHRMNEVMKVLTIVATIFIPLTFVAGIYGMNFTDMPELEWRYGYFATLAGMLVLGIGMLMFFRRKGWL